MMMMKTMMMVTMMMISTKLMKTMMTMTIMITIIMKMMSEDNNDDNDDENDNDDKGPKIIRMLQSISCKMNVAIPNSQVNSFGKISTTYSHLGEKCHFKPHIT